MPAGLAQALQSPVPAADFSLRVTAAPFRGKGRTASVAVIVEASGTDLRLNETQGRFTGTLALLIAAVDGDGRVKASQRGSMNLRLSPATQAVVAEHGARLLARLDLQPGQYQLRVAVLNSADGASGSVHYDLHVPDFTKGPLAVSGIVLASAAASRAPTTGSDKSWPKLMTAPPTTQREFEQGDQLWLFGEIYSGSRKPGQQIAIETIAQAADGAIVLRHSETFAAGASREPSGVFRHTVPIALNDVTPGRYVLTMTTRMEGEAGDPVTRRIPFLVR
jgi:hypothetical protein